MRKFKCLFAMLVAVALVVCLHPLTAYAADNAITVGGKVEFTVNGDQETSASVTFTAPKTQTYVLYAEEFQGYVYYSLSDNYSWIDASYDKLYFEAQAGETYHIEMVAYGWVEEQQNVTVHLDEIVAAKSVSFDRKHYVGFVGGPEISIEAEIQPDNASISGKWISSDPFVATVDEETHYGFGAFVYPEKVGTSTITFVADSGAKASCTVTIKEFGTIKNSLNYSVAANDAVGYIFTPDSTGYYWIDRDPGKEPTYDDNVTLEIWGGNLRLPGNDNEVFYGFSTSGTKECLYLTKGEKYQIVLDNTGSETVSSTLEINKAVKATSVNLPNELTMGVGNNQYIEISYGPDYAIPETVTYTSSNPEVLEVVSQWDDGCLVVANKAGTAVLTVTTENGLADSVTVTVEEYYFDDSYYDKTLYLNTANKVNISEAGDWFGYRFTPTKSGYYQLDHDSKEYVILSVYDAETDEYQGYYFKAGIDGFIMYLEKGKTYYIDTYYYDYENATGSYNVYFTPVTAKTNGWVKCREGWYYFKNNEPVDGWQKIDGKWYYMRTSGSMVKGFREIDGKTYYLGTDGAMKTGWQQVDGKWYYMDASGVMQTGWVKTGGKWYYMDEDGVMQTGWQQIDGKWYYLKSDMKTGWQKIDGKWYYLKSDMKTGWQKVDGKWYHLGTNGVMRTGWQKIDGKWYYLGTNGAMQTGWQKVNGAWYYLGTNGAMQTGWVKLGTNWYYLNSSGIMVTGTQTIEGKTYEFNSSGVWVG